jgi:protein ImuB
VRLACVFVPELALQAALRRNPEARGQAVALFDMATPGAKARVVAVSDEARRAGVRAGMTTAQAGAACPTLRRENATAADLAAALAALADVGYGFAPRIDSQGESGRIFFDVGDLQRLYPSGEAAVAQAIQARAARVGLGVRVAIASSKGIARVATRARELAVVAPGGERTFLAPLPVALLLDEPEQDSCGKRRGAADGYGNRHRHGEGDGNRRGRGRGGNASHGYGERLKGWGIATVGALAALPVAEVVLRLGAGGARLCRLAGGVDSEPFSPQLPVDALEEEIELDYPIYEIEPLAFVLRGLIDRALERLACRSLACAGLTLRLALDPRGLDVRAIPIAAPTREPATLLQLARLDLARRPPAAGVVGATLIALPARVRSTQLDFLRPTGPAPDRLAATIARLAALVGPHNVGTPRAEETWREEAVVVAPYPATPFSWPVPAPVTPSPAGATAAATAPSWPAPRRRSADGSAEAMSDGASVIQLPLRRSDQRHASGGPLPDPLPQAGEGEGEEEKGAWKARGEKARRAPPTQIFRDQTPAPQHMDADTLVFRDQTPEPQPMVSDTLPFRDQTPAPQRMGADALAFRDQTPAPQPMVSDALAFHDQTPAPQPMVSDALAFRDQTPAPQLMVSDTLAFHDQTPAPQPMVSDALAFRDRTLAPQRMGADTLAFRDQTPALQRVGFLGLAGAESVVRLMLPSDSLSSVGAEERVGVRRSDETPAPAGRDGALGLRRFRPAQEIEVLMGREGPIALRGRETTARVLVAAGPYRMNGEWWRAAEPGGAFHRDYWDVHASDGAVYRLRHDQRHHRWYLDGYYD